MAWSERGPKSGSLLDSGPFGPAALSRTSGPLTLPGAVSSAARGLVSDWGSANLMNFSFWEFESSSQLLLLFVSENYTNRTTFNLD